MENLSVEQLQAAHRPFRTQTAPQVRANIKRLGYEWRDGLPRDEVERYAARFLFERHQLDFLAAIPPEPAPPEEAKPKRDKKADAAK